MDTCFVVSVMFACEKSHNHSSSIGNLKAQIVKSVYEKVPTFVLYLDFSAKSH